MEVKYSRKQKITYLVVGVISLGFLTYFFAFTYLSSKELEESAVYTKGVITNNSISFRNKYYAEYKFTVNDKEYKGQSRYFPNRQYIEVGDTCEVVYARNNLVNSNLVVQDKIYIKITKPRFPLELYLDSVQGK